MALTKAQTQVLVQPSESSPIKPQNQAQAPAPTYLPSQMPMSPLIDQLRLPAPPGLSSMSREDVAFQIAHESQFQMPIQIVHVPRITFVFPASVQVYMEPLQNFARGNENARLRGPPFDPSS